MAAHQKYTLAVARTVAQRIHSKYSVQIERASKKWNVPQHYLAGLTGMENPQCYEWPDRRSYRFEAHVYRKFISVRSFSPANLLTWSYNGIRYKHIKGLSDEALRNLAISFGQTQIMAYYILTLFEGRFVADLRDPNQHYEFTCEMLNEDPQLRRHLNNRDFAQVCHVWNSGRTWNGKQGWKAGGKGNIKTWSPYYMYNCALVAQEYKNIVALTRDSVPAPAEPEVQRAYDGELVGDVQQFEAEQIELPDEPPSYPAVEGQYSSEHSDTGLANNAGNTGNPADADVSQLDAKAGWSTSQGQLTGVFTALAALVTMFTGYKFAPERINDLAQVAQLMIVVLSPLALLVPVIISYINHRGKTASNTLWAKAAVIGQAIAPQAGFQIPDTNELKGEQGFKQLQSAQHGWTGGGQAAPLADMQVMRALLDDQSQRPLGVYRNGDIITAGSIGFDDQMRAHEARNRDWDAQDTGVVLTDSDILELFSGHLEAIKGLAEEIKGLKQGRTEPDLKTNTITDDEIEQALEPLEPTEDLLEIQEV